MKTKLIQLTTDPNVGGGPKHIAGLLEQLPTDQFELFAIAPQGWLGDELKDSACQFEALPSDISSLEEKAVALRSILQKIKAGGYPFAPVILHAHTPQAAYLASRAIRGLGIYLIYTEHLWTLDYHLQSSFREWLQIQGLKKALKSASKVIAVSEAVNKFLLKHKISSKDKIEVIYPIAGEFGKVKIKKYESKAKLPVAESVTLGSVGALNPVKGYEYLIAAMAEVKSSFPNIKLEIVGAGPDEESLKAQISSLKLGQTVKIITNAKALSEYYDKWQIYLQPSLSESFGLSVFEAMRRGMPVVASKVGGLTELIDESKSGLLVPSKSSEKLTAAITDLLSDTKFEAKLGAGALEKSGEAQFDPKLNFQKILAIYQELTCHAS
jgi:glycosyltransferase involved in cell wall biosynthesis